MKYILKPCDKPGLDIDDEDPSAISATRHDPGGDIRSNDR